MDSAACNHPLKFLRVVNRAAFDKDTVWCEFCGSLFDPHKDEWIDPKWMEE